MLIFPYMNTLLCLEILHQLLNIKMCVLNV